MQLTNVARACVRMEYWKLENENFVAQKYRQYLLDI